MRHPTRPLPDRRLPLAFSLVLLALLWACALPAWSQQASIGYMKHVFTDPEVNDRHETNTRIVIQHWDKADKLIATFICGAPSICSPFIPNGSARYAMALEYDSAREELMRSSCGNVVDTVPQGQCINAPLSVSMRVRFGEVRWRFVADPRPNRPYSAPFGGNFGPTPRMEFPSTGTDPVKWWVPNKYVNRGGNSLGGVLTPAGNYVLKLDPMRGHCKPVHTNPDAQLRVNEGQLTEFTVRYTGTVCTLSIQSYATSATRVPDDAGSFTSDPAGLQCNANPNARTCKAEFPFDSTVRLIGNPKPGFNNDFNRNFTGCSSAEPDRRICQILADGDRELSSTMAAVTALPPPPPPVTLAAALGSASPADATVPKGSNGVTMLQVQLTPGNGVARLQALSLQASGSGRDDLDLGNLRVYQDSNANGQADAGEPLLGSGRLMADNGNVRLALATPLEISQPTALVVVTDVANTVHSAAAATFGGVVLALGAVGWVRGRRSSARCLVAAWLAAALLLAACGGNEPVAEPATAPPAVVVDPVTPPVVVDPVTPPVVVDPVTPPVVVDPITPPVLPPPVLLTYRLQLMAVEATDTATTPASLPVAALPLAGALITVAQ